MLTAPNQQFISLINLFKGFFKKYRIKTPGFPPPNLALMPLKIRWKDYLTVLGDYVMEGPQT